MWQFIKIFKTATTIQNFTEKNIYVSQILQNKNRTMLFVLNMINAQYFFL